MESTQRQLHGVAGQVQELAYRKDAPPGEVPRAPAPVPAPPAIPPGTTPPDEVKRWWEGLGPGGRAYLTQRAPEAVGNLDGIPAADRDAANRVMMGRLESCNDQGEAPFRGRAAVHYPPAATVDAAAADAERFADRLREAGWSSDPEFHSGATHVERDGVTLILETQGAGDTVRVLTALGECRDVTTTKQTRGGVEEFSVGG